MDITLDKIIPHLEGLKSQGFIEYSIEKLGLIVISQEQGVKSELRLQVQPKYQELASTVFAKII